jgi:oligopeptide/dipeptide ABC transporter ATP-binding protein
MRIGNYPHQMSGGMRQRVMIAMALSCNPQLLIADEPTTALDVTIQAQILNLMNQLKRKTGTSIMLITHDMGVVAETAQHVVVMYAGRVVEQADVRSLFASPKHPYTIGLMESMPSLTHLTQKNKRLKAIPGTVPNLLELGKGCPFKNRCHKSDQLCSQELPKLRDLGPKHKVRCFHV